MRNLFTLFKVMFKTDDLLQLNIEKGGPLKRKLITGLFGIAMIISGFSFSPMVIDAYKLLRPLGLQGLIVKLVLLIASFTTIFFSFLFIMNAFYFSQDVENYLYLPVKQGDIVLSKLGLVTLYQILSTLVLFYPSLIVFGKISNYGTLFYIKAFLAVALVPIIPMAIIGIISMLVMKNSKLFKNKDRFTTIMTGLGVILAVGLNFVTQKLALTTTGGTMELPPIFTGKGISGKILGILFPSAMTLSNGLNNDTFLLNFIIVLVITAVILYLFYIIGNKIYFDGARGLNESSSKREKLSLKQLKNSTLKSSSVKALALKEFRILTRTPSYLMNGVLTTILIPIFLLIPILAGSKEMKDYLLKIDLSKLSLSPYLIMLVVIGIMFSFAIINLMTATSISREGKDFYFMKYIPIPYRVQILGKIIPAFIINNLSLLVVILALAFTLKVNLKFVLIGYLCGLIISITGYFISIVPDVIRPNLTWVSETKAMKQNFNPFFSVILGGALILLVIVISHKLKLSFKTIFIIIMSFSVIFNALFYYLLNSFVDKAFNKLS